MYVFVYGTLKKGFHNHQTLRGAECVAKKAMLRGYDMYHLGGFPGIVPGDGTVYGEVYEITEDHLPWLDRLEGYSPDAKPEHCMYIREQVCIPWTHEEDLDVFVYVWNSDVTDREKIESGIWE